MTDTKADASERWTMRQAIVLAAACLIAGIACGWLLRLWKPPVSASASPVAAAAPASQAASDPAHLKQAADAEAAPLLAQLRSDPANADLLTRAGNLYYDAQLYAAAIDYYNRALAIRPSDVDVRTDMGTACWYMGNAAGAIAAFTEALRYQPNNPNTLFNRGLVRWQGKMDGAGAISDWKQLLAANPGYPDKAKVEQMISDVEKHAAIASQSKQAAQ